MKWIILIVSVVGDSWQVRRLTCSWSSHLTPLSAETWVVDVREWPVVTSVGVRCDAGYGTLGHRVCSTWYHWLMLTTLWLVVKVLRTQFYLVLSVEGVEAVVVASSLRPQIMIVNIVCHCCGDDAGVRTLYVSLVTEILFHNHWTKIIWHHSPAQLWYVWASTSCSLVMLGPETRAPVVPGHQDVDDDEADGDDSTNQDK